MNKRLEEVAKPCNISLRFINEINGIDVYMSSALIKVCGLGCVSTIRMDTGENVIIVEDDFFQYPKYVRAFFIYHELGHLFHKDLDRLLGADKKIRYLNARICAVEKGKVLDMEAKADQYAARNVGVFSTILALYWLSTHLPDAIGRKECKIRYWALIRGGLN